jgi:hypothetical protein
MAARPSAAHSPMLTIVLPDDLCAAEISMRFMQPFARLNR